MLKARLQQPCLHTQPGQAAHNPCVCGTAEGDIQGDTICWQEMGSRGVQRCHQLRDAPASEPVEQEGWMGPQGGKPEGLNGDTMGPLLDGSSLALAAEPAAPPKCPSSAPEVPPAATSPPTNPSQEWKVVKIQRVLIQPASKPRKAGKRNPLWPCSPSQRALHAPGTVLGTPSSSQGRTSTGFEVPGSRLSPGTVLA